MLAERLPGRFLTSTPAALEVSAVHSLAGFNLADELITRPPYSDPSGLDVAVVGGITIYRSARHFSRAQ
jgi:magnesium chelatase family protein